MKRDDKKALYESIMTSVAKEVKKTLSESNFASTIDSLGYNILLGKDKLFNALVSKPLSISQVLEDPRILRKIAGFIVEARTKKRLQDALGDRCKDGYDNWWDCEIDGEKIEIKAFQKGKLYSNMHATKNQVDKKDDLTFILVEYQLRGDDVEITGIAIVDGADIEFDETYNRLKRNRQINFVRDI